MFFSHIHTNFLQSKNDDSYFIFFSFQIPFLSFSTIIPSYPQIFLLSPLPLCLHVLTVYDCHLPSSPRVLPSQVHTLGSTSASCCIVYCRQAMWMQCGGLHTPSAAPEASYKVSSTQLPLSFPVSFALRRLLGLSH